MAISNRNNTFQLRLKAVLFGLLWLALSGCSYAPRPMLVRSDVDALAVSDAQGKRRFAIMPGNKDTAESDLQFIEFKNYVEKALEKRGFIKAPNLQEGDVVLFLSYGIGEPQVHQYAYDVPVWNGFGYYGYGYYPYGRRYGFYPRMGMYGVGGYAQRIESFTLYKRYLMLDAYEMTAYLQKQPPQQLWKLNAQSQGESHDLRLTFPFMVAAMQPYIAVNTGRIVTVDVDETSPLLRDIRYSNPLPSQITLPPAQ